MNWLLKLLGPATETPIPIANGDPVVAALVERCGRLTGIEAGSLACSWAAIERDEGVQTAMAEGRRQAGRDADRAASDADWAYRWTLKIPGDGAIYAPLDPTTGRVIEAIRAHATAVAARDRLSLEVAKVMSAPWHAAIHVE